ncbi:MAG: HDOD domain-containing protein [Pirellulaceae bacterium]|nr:HDOD domain-containing protein [Planctomycetales bacterium]
MEEQAVNRGYLRIDQAHTCARVIQLCRRDEVDLPHVCRIVVSDQTLVDAVLTEANAMRMGTRAPIRTVEHAASFLGARRVARIAETCLRERNLTELVPTYLRAYIDRQWRVDQPTPPDTLL